MAPNKVGDNSSIEVSEEVLRHGGSAVGPTTLRSGGVDIKGEEVDPPLVALRGNPETTYKAWVLLGASIAFCLFTVLLGVSVETHVLNSIFPTDGAN
ncbi:UNVERIFIED_CONTAM: hypothetical protein Sradi_1294700 [Sesamum radiatum]|uniref:Uncharacterized protein n=1 Tax=Sesamum radiatum TaxID=300843 RepID=A0AAW2UPK3_SESRA